MKTILPSTILFRVFVSSFFVVTFFSCNVTAQNYVTKDNASKKAIKQYNIGRDYLVGYNVEKAAASFRKAIKIDPKFIDAHIYLGEVYQELNDYKRAELEYEKVIELDPTYNPKVYYTLAILENNIDKPEESKGHFRKYIESKGTREELVRKSKRYIELIDFREEMKRHPVPFEPKPMGVNINTKFGSEYLPSLSADQTKFVFTRKIYGQEDFYMSIKEEGEWQMARPIEELNSPGNEGAFSISADGKTILYTLCDRRENIGTCDLYISELKNEHWTRGRNMGSVVNSRAWDSQPCLSPDSRVLYFTSNRKGGYGGSDIWISLKKAGKWTKPFNAGKKINTKEDEQSPFMHEDGKTLYFSSKGHFGMGNYDLFKVVLGEDQHWGEAINLGYPINTKGNDGAMIVALDGKTAYFSSNYLLDSTRKDMDLFSFELYDKMRATPSTFVRGVVRDYDTKQRIKANVKIGMKGSSREIDVETGLDGEFLVCLPLGDNYFFNVVNSDYIFYSENFDLKEIKTDLDPVEKDIYLKKIEPKDIVQSNEKSTPIVLRNVFFDTGKSDLKPESTFELDNLVKLLNNHPDISIQISGHTDNVGSPDANQLLSENRAKAVVDYLVSKGISKDRLVYKGYGESKPVADNSKEEGRRQNRRTEFIIL